MQKMQQTHNAAERGQVEARVQKASERAEVRANNHKGIKRGLRSSIIQGGGGAEEGISSTTQGEN